MQSNVVLDASNASEADPLLPALNNDRRRRKPFYRPRPLWLVPFAVVASLIRGMTLAPRVQVFTQLSCAQIYDKYNPPPSPDSTPTLSPFLPLESAISNFSVDIHPLHHLSLTSIPPASFDVNDMSISFRGRDSCSSNPAVQARAARLQTTFMILMGVASALSTGWWGHFGEKHGRMRVLAFSTLGLMLSDLTFVLVSDTRSFVGPQYGQILLTVVSFVEGALGGWTSLQGATSAYLSDCTSDGKSRARVFSRFNGVFYLGFALGPTLGAWLIRHPFTDAGTSTLRTQPVKSVTSVFYAAAICSFVNLLCVLFIFPESLHSKSGPPSMEESFSEERVTNLDSKGAKAIWADFVEGFSHVMVVFGPKTKELSGGRKRRDWSLTLLACSLFGYFLGSGVFQIKYLFAEHVYGWGSEELSYYIFLAGGLRAVHLLFILPFLIATFKPLAAQSTEPGTSLPTRSGAVASDMATQLAKEMRFDLTMTKVSFALDVLSHTLVSIATTNSTTGSQAMFVGFSVISGLGSGVIPTVQSLSLGYVKSAGGDQTGAGKLFGAIAALQALGQMILGPMLFALVYGRTVAYHPKAIFNMAAVILGLALVLIQWVQVPKTQKPKKAQLRDSPETPERPRGRSRKTKYLRGLSVAEREDRMPTANAEAPTSV